MLIVSKTFLTSSATVIVRTGGAIWLNPFPTVLFSVCSSVTVECCVLYPRVAWVCLVCLLLCKEEGSSPVSAITERRDMGPYEIPLYVSLLSFGMGTMLANCHMGGIMLVLRAVLNILVGNTSPRRSMCFRCLICSL